MILNIEVKRQLQLIIDTARISCPTATIIVNVNTNDESCILNSYSELIVCKPITDRLTYLNMLANDELQCAYYFDLKQKPSNYTSEPLILKSGLKVGHIAFAYFNNEEIEETQKKLVTNFAKLTTNIIENHIELNKVPNTYQQYIRRNLHDLKSPCTTLSLCSELLLQPTLEIEKLPFIGQKISNATQNILNILNQARHILSNDNKASLEQLHNIDLSDYFTTLSNNTNKLQAVSLPSKVFTLANQDIFNEAFRYTIDHLNSLSEEIITNTITIKQNELELTLQVLSNTQNLINSTQLTIAKLLFSLQQAQLTSSYHPTTKQQQVIIVLKLNEQP